MPKWRRTSSSSCTPGGIAGTAACRARRYTSAIVRASSGRARRIVTEGATAHRRVPVVTSTGPLTQQQVNRSVVAILVSVFASAAAALAQATVLGKLVFDLTGRELDLGLL